MSDTKTLQAVDCRELYRRWAQGAGPFECFIRKSNFVSLQHYPEFVLKPVNKQKSRLFRQLAPELQTMTAQQLVIFDIPAVAGMRLAYLVQTHLNKKPVLVYSSPLHPNGLIGGEPYVNALVGYGEALEPCKPGGYVFILDCHRFRKSLSKKTLLDRFNNQYEITADDLPGIDMLQVLGFSHVMFYHRGELRDDTNAYLEYLRSQGITVELRHLHPLLFK